jgi:uncharacterized protein
MAKPRCILEIKAVPNAPRSEIIGWLGDALKVRLQAPPGEGKANAELCTFLAKQFGLTKRAVTIANGDTSRLKRVRIEGLSVAEIHARLDSNSS